MKDPAPSREQAPVQASQKMSSELALRVLSGLVMAILALSAAWIGGWVFSIFWTFAALMVLREWLALIGLTERPLLLSWGIGGTGIAIAGAFAEGGIAAISGAWLVALLAALIAALVVPGSHRRWVGTGVLYAAVISIVPIAIRSDAAHGFVALLWVFGVVWLTDIGAYFAGRAIGGPKLWPAVSPKKTWSGFIGGVLAGTLTALGLVWIAKAQSGVVWLSGGGLLILTVIAAALSQGGDLLESALKRKFNVKDSSHLIPGHGGFMDRLDAFWAVCLLLGLILPFFRVGQ